MPYPRWLETLRLHADRIAIRDSALALTFSELAAMVSKTPVARGPVIARSGGLGFFVEILRAWRDGQPVIPVERDAPEPVLASKPPAGTLLVKYTPGASGIPRGIFFNGEQILADGDRLTAAMGLRPETANLAAISLSHSYGFSNVVLPLLFQGVPVHLAPVPFPRVIEEIFRSHASLVVPAVPSMWRAWHRAGILKDAPVSLALSAGAPLSLALENDVFGACGLKIRNFYGTSECGGISMDLSDRPRTSVTDVGTLLRGVAVETSAEGRLLVTSTAVATGYDCTRHDDLLGDGRYLTRDLGYVDQEGKVQLTGTTGGAINVAGRKVSPAKVEAAILSTGLARRVRVFGIASADAERFEEISAEVSLGEAVTLDALKTAVAQTMQAWEMPRHWTVG